ncbi:MAG: hypothetical protein ACI942_002776, partial [Planctomycetota bacterium]
PACLFVHLDLYSWLLGFEKFSCKIIAGTSLLKQNRIFLECFFSHQGCEGFAEVSGGLDED